MDYYFGWNGVDGQLETPPTNLSLGDPNFDHAAGYLNAQLSHSGAPNTWLQIGWFKGTIAGAGYDEFDPCLEPQCIRSATGFAWYAENHRLGTGYSADWLGSASFGALTTSRVVWNSVNGCWEAFLTYSQSIRSMGDCSSEPPTGAMVASLETISNGSVVPVPLVHFGASNPNTNQALRLHGANGWEPWDTFLLAWGTESHDERTATPRYTKSDINSAYYFLAWGP